MLFNVAANFKLEGQVVSVEPYGSGHINVTYLASYIVVEAV